MASATATAQPLTNGKLKLMICDDSNILRRKIERELQIDRLQVIATASNGKHAVETNNKKQTNKDTKTTKTKSNREKNSSTTKTLCSTKISTCLLKSS